MLCPFVIVVKLLWRKVTAIDLKKMSVSPQNRRRNKFTNILFSAKQFLLALAGPQDGRISILKCEILHNKHNCQFGILV
jgi:hypothetical protein